jgi:hypothetical protein
MKKLLEILFGPHTIFALFTVAIIMALASMIEVRIFNIPDRYVDGVWLSNIVLAFIVYFVSVWLNKPE